VHFPPVFILRHGQTKWNLEGRLQGRRDSPLTDLGIQQAQIQRRLLAQVHADYPDLTVISSPQGRARRTAEIATEGLDLSLTFEDRVQEVFAGEWEGQTRAVIREEFLNPMEDFVTEFDLFLNTPGGERFDDLHDRCLSVLQELTRPTAIVTHGITGCVLRGLVLDLPIDEMDKLERGQGCIYRLENGAETCLRES